MYRPRCTERSVEKTKDFRQREKAKIEDRREAKKRKGEKRKKEGKKKRGFKGVPPFALQIQTFQKKE